MAFALMILAVTVASGAALAWLWLALSVASFVMIAPTEEADLPRRFGHEYREHQQTVPMFFARVGPAIGRDHVTGELCAQTRPCGSRIRARSTCCIRECRVPRLGPGDRIT
jgi:hypothetical protein